MSRSQAISQFGVVCGMTLPMLSLPIVFLGAINLVLAPRLARACALCRGEEVRRLVSRAAEAVCLLTLPAMALMVVVGPDLGRVLFHQAGAGEYLIPLAAATAMSCCCSVLSAALNGIGSRGRWPPSPCWAGRYSWPLPWPWFLSPGWVWPALWPGRRSPGGWS